MIPHMASTPPPPSAPEWVTQLIQVVSNCISSDDPIRWMEPYLHDEGDMWHVEVCPSIFLDGGEEFFRTITST